MSAAPTDRRESLLKKIQALFDRADVRRGATEAEAETCMRLARELMTKHGIESIDITQRNGEKQSSAWEITSDGWDTDRVRRTVDIYVVRVLREAFGVNTVFCEYRRPGKVGNAVRYVFIGDKADCEVAKYAAPILYSNMRGGYNQWVAEHDAGWRTGHEHSFCRGVAEGYLKASEEGRQAVLDKMPPASRENYALALVNKEALVLAKKAELFPKLTNIRFGKSESSSSAYSRGYAVGKDLSLRPKPRLGKKHDLK